MKIGITVVILLAAIIAVMILVVNHSTDEDRLAREPMVDRDDTTRAEPAESRTGERAPTVAGARRDAAVRKEVEPTTITVSVHFDDGAAAADVRMVALTASGQHDDVRTDAQGRFSVDGRFADGWVAACPIDARPHIEKLEVRDGAAKFIIPRGATVRGRLIVDDAEPGETVPMTWGWTTWSTPILPIPQEIVTSFVNATGIDLLDRRRVVATTKADGTFEFHGLVAGESGKVAADMDGERSLWSIEGAQSGPAHVDVVCPDDNVVVRTTRGIVFSGRVIREKDRSPIANAPLAYESRWRIPGGGGGSFGKTTEADHDGRFRIAVPRSATDFLLVAKDPASGVSRNVVVEGPFTESRDLGDVVCPTIVPIEVTVVDQDGRPIEGACIAWSSSEWTPFVESAKDGTAKIARMDDATELRIAKRGFHPVLEKIEGKGPASVRVRLDTGTVLRLRTVFENGSTPIPINVNVRSDVALFDSEDGIADSAMYAALDAEKTRRYKSGVPRVLREHEAKDLRTLIPPDQSISLEFLKPGIEFEVHGFADDFSARRSVVLSAGQTTELVFTIGQSPRRVFGRIVDPTGRPIADANIQIRDRGRGGDTGARSDESGSFSTEAKFSDCVEILVSHRDWAFAHLTSVAVPKTAAIADIVLAPALTFILDIVDKSGEPVEGAHIRSRGWTNVREIEGRPGSYKLGNLGPDPLSLVIHASGASYPFSIDPRAGTGKLTIAASGRIDVTWDFDLPNVDTTIIVARNTNTNEGGTMVVIAPKNRGAGGSATFKHLSDGPWEIAISVMDDPNSKYRPIGRMTTIELKHGATERGTISRD